MGKRTAGEIYNNAPNSDKIITNNYNKTKIYIYTKLRIYIL